jgi:asparagine synthase (glutamine-hydrolysing)
VKTFSIGFQEPGYDEAANARVVAEHLHTDHTEFYATPEEAQKVVPLLPDMFDEPFADSAQIPTYLVSKLVRSDVTVSLTGDSGDELFGGYTHYRRYGAPWGRLRRLPLSARRLAATLLTAVPQSSWDRSLSPIRPLLSPRQRRFTYGDRIHRSAHLIARDRWEEVYSRLTARWPNSEDAVVRGFNPPSLATDRSRWAALPSLEEHMMYMDLIDIMPDGFLVKVDRASMATSLEARVPFLDHRVVSSAAHLPLTVKLRDGQGKWILREALARYVPLELVDRPKQGFIAPIGAWLRGPLRN